MVLALSPLVLGFWRLRKWGFTAQEILALTERAVELGITGMDHAMVYRSEASFGEALALRPGLRNQVQLISKCGIRPKGFGELGAQGVNHYDFSRAYTVRSVEASLRDLGTDRLDLLLLHRPDLLMDNGEVAETFAELKGAGKVLHFGVSNFSVHQVECLQSALPEPLVTNQIEFSPLQMGGLDDGTLDQAQRLGMRPMLWSALGGGRLFSPKSERELAVVSALTDVANQVGAPSIAAAAYAWSMALPSRPHLILGTSKIERVEDAVQALTIKLSREHWYRIWEASNGASVP